MDVHECFFLQDFAREKMMPWVKSGYISTLFCLIKSDTDMSPPWVPPGLYFCNSYFQI